MMDCRTARLLMPYSRPGELPAEDAEALARHVDQCSSCRALVAAEQSFDRAVAKAMTDVPAREDLRGQIGVRLAQESARVWRRHLLQVATAASILLVALVLGFGWWSSKIDFEPEQYIEQVEEPNFVRINNSSLESAEEYFRSRNLKTELPRALDYSLLKQLEVAEMKGKPVARLDFARGEARAKVYVLPKRQFRVGKNAAREAIGSNCTVEVDDSSSRDYLFVIVYFGGGNRQMFQPQAVIG